MFRSRIIAAAIFVLGASLGGIGDSSLHAQPTSPSDPAKVDIAAPMNSSANLSPGEMAKKSEELIGGMKSILRRVLQLQQAARKQKDIIKLNCVNDKLLQVKQLLNIAESSRTNFTEAVANGDSGARQHQFSQITVASDQAQSMRDEAEACIGEELTFVGPTEVEVDKPAIPDDPTKDDPFDFGSGAGAERPAFATPYN